MAQRKNLELELNLSTDSTAPPPRAFISLPELRAAPAREARTSEPSPKMPPSFLLRQRLPRRSKRRWLGVGCGRRSPRRVFLDAGQPLLCSVHPAAWSIGAVSKMQAVVLVPENSDSHSGKHPGGQTPRPVRRKHMRVGRFASARINHAMDGRLARPGFLRSLQIAPGVPRASRQGPHGPQRPPLLNEPHVTRARAWLRCLGAGTATTTTTATTGRSTRRQVPTRDLLRQPCRRHFVAAGPAGPKQQSLVRHRPP